MHEINNYAKKRLRLRNNRLGELVGAPGDQKHTAINFVIVKISLVL